MAAEYEATTFITICGQPRRVEVVFEVESWGSSDSYWEPGDPPSIIINDVRDATSDRSLYDFCEQVRNLWGAKQSASMGGGYPTILDYLYEHVVCDHFPDYEPSDADIYLDFVHQSDYRTEHDV